MADLDDITSLIFRAQGAEESDPHKAHGMYEVAERRLDNYLFVVYHLTRDVLETVPESSISKRFLPYYGSIIDGYTRLTKSS